MPYPGIPVLMYHALVETHEPYMAAIHVETAAFAQQMAWLAANGYYTISPQELLEALRQRRPLPQAVVITFDDGYASLHQWARPILARAGFSATLFLTTDPVEWPTYENVTDFGASVPRHDRPLTWPEIHALQAAGWDIQAHSRTHRSHAALPGEELRQELAGSKTQIESRLHTPVHFYAFPYGHYTARALHQLQLAGYTAGFSVHPGHARPRQDVRRLPRLEITAQCDLAEFQRKVESGYGSARERYRSKVREVLFWSPRLKDALQKRLGRFSSQV